jgi:hypothetical protein
LTRRNSCRQSEEIVDAGQPFAVPEGRNWGTSILARRMYNYSDSGTQA